jgi:uroporphyrinogen-III synthase
VTQPLDGWTVVVTRPERQAEPLLRLFRESGAAAVAFPTLVIERIDLDDAARRRCTPDAYDWVIFTSANAVECALAQLPRPQRARVAAVGRATARALAGLGVAVDATPADVSDSEGLLATRELAEVLGRRILILKGAGGRDKLRESLAARGAAVTLGEVYRRGIAAPDQDALERLARACAADAPVIAVTSVEVLDALLALAPDAGQPRLRRAALLVPGDRVAAAARERGWSGRLIVAPSAEDATMVATLERAVGAGGMPRPA